MDLLKEFDIFNIHEKFRQIILDEYNQKYFREIFETLN